MNRIILLVCFSFWCLLVTTKAQTPTNESSDVLRQLLSLPAPTPRTVVAVADTEKMPTQRPPQFFSKDKAPPDDAPLEDLLAYWERWAGNSDRPDLSDAARKRLLDASADDLSRLPQFLPLLSRTETTARQVKELYDQGLGSEELDERWRDQVKTWLVFNSKYFLRDLLVLANRVKDNDKSGYVDQEKALKALANVDWSSAEPLVQSLANGEQLRTTALALTLLYQQAWITKDADAEEKYRDRLRGIASDRHALAYARDAAIEALSLSKWSGQDEWYVSILADDTLRECSDGHTLFHPLQTLFDRDPDKWIPVMAKLVDSKERAVQQAAASCLVIYATGNPRRDAILPVLRWLSDPDWLDINGTQRAWFMQKMDELEMPESVPGLIWIVENEDHNRMWAARTLVHYKDARAIPALKRALMQERDDARRYIIEGLVASGGLSETEQLEGIEAYAAKLMTPEGSAEVQRYRAYDDDPLPVPVSIGRYFANLNSVPEPLAQAVLARAKELQKKNPERARALLDIAQRWQARQVDLDILHRIAQGTADAPTIANALERRIRFRETVSQQLQSLVTITGAPQGIAAVLLEDVSLAQSLIAGGNQSGQVALLACARLTQMALPVDAVGTLMRSTTPLVALAAERYLLAEDSKEARQLLQARHPNEAFVTGWRENIQLIAGSNFDAMGKVEEKLRAELFKENPPLEIYALLGNDEQPSRVLRVYHKSAVYTHYEDPARYRERVISSAEFTTFKNFITTSNLEDSGPQFGPCHHDCWVTEFVLITKEKGRRVFSHQGINGRMLAVFANFALLGRGENSKTRYNLENEIKGLEVVYDDDKLVVRDVWQRGVDVRLLVEREETPEEREERQDSDNSSDEDEDEATLSEKRRREFALKKARFSWRTFKNDRLDAVTSQPDGYSTFDESRFPPDVDDPDSRLKEGQAQVVSENSIVLTRNFDGLWRQAAGQKAVRISGEEGAYDNPIVTSDRKWVVVAKTDSDWSKPNYIVRFNLQTGREYRVDIGPADDFNPVAFVASHGKVLLRRAKDDYELSRHKSIGPEAPEYYLLDAATGQTQLVSGVFAPLLQEGKRFLQPAGKPNEFWVAIPDRARNQTKVGRYSLKDFSFQSALTLPHIAFESMSMWVDETGAKLYVVYEGQLLRLPLPVAR